MLRTRPSDCSTATEIDQRTSHLLTRWLSDVTHSPAEYGSRDRPFSVVLCDLREGDLRGFTCNVVLTCDVDVPEQKLVIGSRGAGSQDHDDRIGCHALKDLQVAKIRLTADKEIGDEFYAEYQELREKLIAETAAAGHAPEAAVSMAQTILDRILFVAFAEDRQLLPRDLLKHTAEARNAFAPRPVWDNFKGLFRLIDHGGEINLEGRKARIHAYNGGLFRREPADVGERWLRQAFANRAASAQQVVQATLG